MTVSVPPSRNRRALAFLAAVVLAVAWGSVVQTQLNLAGLAALGAPVPLDVRLATTVRDLSGFGPFYAILVLAGLMPALFFAGLLARRLPHYRDALFALAGAVGLIAAIRAVDATVPPPTLMWATRGWGGLLAMAAGAALGAWVYARLTRSSGALNTD